MPKFDLFDGEEEPGPSFLAQFGEDAVSPLIILGEETLEKLTEKQQKFLLARMAVSTDVAAAKFADVAYNTVWKWKHDEGFKAFQKAYQTIRQNPLNFAQAIGRQLVAKAALEHMVLLSHPNARVRQWAIELAYRNQGVGQEKGQTQNNYIVPFEMLKQLSRETPVEADGSIAIDEPEPGEYRSLPEGLAPEEGRMDPVREGPEVLSQ